MDGTEFLGLLLSLPLGAWVIILMFVFLYFAFLNEW